MKFKGLAIPPVSKGIRITEPDQVVPDQSLTLRDILTRFVRREALPVAHQGVYGSEGSIDPESDSPFNVDQEKLRHADLTVKDEFRELVAEHEREYKRALERKAETGRQEKAEKDKADFEKKVRIEARKLARKKPPEGGSI